MLFQKPTTQIFIQKTRTLRNVSFTSQKHIPFLVLPRNGRSMTEIFYLLNPVLHKPGAVLIAHQGLQEGDQQVV
jgi:hypothetical protein